MMKQLVLTSSLLSVIVISCVERPKPPEVLAVETPAAVSAKLNPADSGNFIFLTDHHKIRMIHNGDTSAALSVNMLDDSFKKYRAEITEKNVYIFSYPVSEPANFKKLKEALMKASITRFRIITDGEAPPAGSELAIPENKSDSSPAD